MDEDQKKRKFTVTTQRFWLNIFFALGLILILIINLISLNQLSRFTLSNKWVTHTYQVMQAANDILLNHLNAVGAVRGYLLTGDERFIANLDVITQDMFVKLALTKSLTTDNSEQHKKLQTLEPLLQERVAVWKKSIALKKKGSNIASENKLIYLGQLITDKIQNIIQNFYEEEFLLLQHRESAAAEDYTKTLEVVMLLNGISILVLLAIIIIFNKRLRELLNLKTKLYRSETLQRGIINATNDYIAAVDLNLKYLAFNRSFEDEFKRIFGKRPQIGMSVADSLSLVPEDIESALNLWTRAISGEEFTVISKFGDKTISNDEYEITFSAIYSEDNKLIGASHLARNISKRLEQERSLQMAKEEIEYSYRALKKHDSEITVINEMNSALQSAASFDETLAMIKNYCVQLLSFARGALYIINSSRNYLEPLMVWDNPKLKDNVLFPDQCWGLRQGKIYKCFNETKNLPCKHTTVDCELYPSVCVPLLAQNNIIGLLYLQLKKSSTSSIQALVRIVDENEFLIENIGGHISLAITNMKLRETLKIRSIRDSLTDLYNRSYLDESLYREIERASRKNISLAIVMIDLDHFKDINDTLGHEAGDRVLKQVGQLLLTLTRKSDIACRYGGDEFLIMIYDVNQAIAYARVDELRRAISHLNINFGGQSVGTITASFGVSIYPDDFHEFNQLIAAADQALYKSKMTGRNKITMYSPKK